MERNINGYPEGRAPSCRTGDTATPSGCAPDAEATLGGRPLAYAYIPVQSFRMLHPTDAALYRGTLFIELDKPMEVYGNE